MHQDSRKPSPSPTLPRKRGREQTENHRRWHARCSICFSVRPGSTSSPIANPYTRGSHAAADYALAILSGHESSTARLDEAVAAYRAALEVFEPANASYYVKLARQNLAPVEALLAKRRSHSSD